ncbi:MAG: aldo/keto reductase [Planctomycetota bacterium]
MSLAEIPAVGLGTWKIPNASTADVVFKAASLGYRHFDCACDYGNEAEVGDGLARVFAETAVARDDIWVTSKLWNTFHEPQHVRPAIERTLSDLKLKKLDLYHVHFPIALKYVAPETRYPPEWNHDPDAPEPRMEPIDVPYIDTWRAMEELIKAGLTERIGVCNLGVSQLRDLLTQCRVRPANLQIELHPRLPQDKLLRFCRDEGIAVTAFSPLGATSYVGLGMATAEESLLSDPAVGAIADKHGRTPAQVLLAWGLGRGTSAIPMSTDATHLAENLAAADLNLDAEDAAALAGLASDRRYNDPGVFCEAAFGRFYPIFD